MESQVDKYNMKERILKDVGKSIKLIQQYSLGIENSFNGGGGGTSGSKNGGLNNNSWLMQSLCCHLDLVFRHGLRDPLNGFWPLLHGLSHSDTLQLIDELQHISSPLGKGLAWLHHTLTEGTLQSYVLCLTQDRTTLRKYYTSKALLRDPSCSHQLLTLLAGLETVTFNITMDGPEQAETSGFSGLTSMTSSLSSPVDSGVALLDSDADITSANEATVNEADLVSLKEEEALLPELEDNLINDQIASQEQIKSKDSFPSIYSYTENDDSVHTQRTENEELVHARKANEEIERTGNNKHGNSTSCMNDAERKKESKSGAKCIENMKLKQGMKDEICTLKDSSLEKSDVGNNRLSKSCVGLIEGHDSLEPCMSPDSLVDNKWSSEHSAMSMSVGAEGTVVRRQRKKKRSGPDSKVKRVSFHEDLLMRADNSTAGFSASFLPPNPVIKCDVVKGRYSWCAEGDAPFVEQRKNDNDTKSDVYLSCSLPSENENILEEKGTLTASENKMSLKDAEADVSKNVAITVKCMSPDMKAMPPVTERGIPEGQEDPPKTSSLLHLNSITDSVLMKFPSMASSIDWSSDTESDSCDRRVTRNIRRMISIPGKEDSSSPKSHVAPHRLSAFMPASKNPLLNRFMKSISQKKQKQRKLKLPKPRSLYIAGAKPDPIAARISVDELKNVRAQMKVFSKPSVCYGPSFERAIKGHIFQDISENVYKVFKVNSSYFVDGKSKPLLIILSDNGLYFVGLQSNFSYCLRLKMSYKELDGCIVGPNHQTLHFVGVNNSKQMLITSSNEIVTQEIISHIEVAMRRSSTKPALPAIRQLLLEDMKTLKLQLSRDTAFLHGEELHHYSIVHIQDNPTSPPSTPLGPSKEGHLMFRPATSAPLQPWEPGYFVLKGGVVYMFNDRGCRLPKRVIPLHAGQCQGCRHIKNEARPHTFEILLGRNRSFQFAAADDYEASEWLQALVQAASGFYEMDQVNSTPCSLIVTSQHVVTCQEKFPSGCVNVLTCAAIVDLVAFSVASDDECWCVLEFACHEVHESSGDWAVYFSTSDQLNGFRCEVEKLWKKLNPQMKFPVRDITNAAIHQRCAETSHYLLSAWDDMLLVDQQE